MESKTRDLRGCPKLPRGTFNSSKTAIIENLGHSALASQERSALRWIPMKMMIRMAKPTTGVQLRRAKWMRYSAFLVIPPVWIQAIIQALITGGTQPQFGICEHALVDHGVANLRHFPACLRAPSWHLWLTVSAG